MLKNLFSLFFLLMTYSLSTISAQKADTIQTSKGNLTMHFLGHGSLWFEYMNLNIYVDPWSKVAQYKEMPKADLVLITHSHMDHLDTTAIAAIRKENTQIIYTLDCAVLAKLKGKVHTISNGEKMEFHNIAIKAVPAYNIIAKKQNGELFHPKGEGNGYVVTFANKKVYIAGDTENIPEMKNLTDIDIAFLPMNLPYTMTPEQVADATRMFHPKTLYPYHYGETDVSQITDLLKNDALTGVKIRDLK